MKTIPALLMVMAATGVAMAQTDPMVVRYESVSVTGEAVVTTAPDRVTFTAGVQTAASDVDTAVRQNNEQTRRVIEALKRAGATDAEISTSNFAIWPQQDYQEGRTPRITGFVVNNQVTVTGKDPTQASKLLTAAIGAGANNVSGLTMSVSNMDRVRAEGLRRAVENARARASILASAAGRTLGRAIVITEGGAATPPPMPYYRAEAAMVAKDSSVPVEAGESEVRFVVNVTYELE